MVVVGIVQRHSDSLKEDFWREWLDMVMEDGEVDTQGTERFKTEGDKSMLI